MWEDRFISDSRNAALEQQRKNRSETKVCKLSRDQKGHDGEQCRWNIRQPHGDVGVTLAILKSQDLHQIIRRVQDQVDSLIDRNSGGNQCHPEEVQDDVENDHAHRIGRWKARKK